ncbi:hypothetical protein WICMUC_005406 [Wickerhamomyces mucosus]|uniref:Uncharacterized protein n=1 Tax=Wickerhamomyces mucosus TaxID=1378264 RepID=A0A9P8P8U8_9ASCO|nr:hypothetical protein WICMUC_005406 [Wickerhamomyces mucosus]
MLAEYDEVLLALIIGDCLAILPGIVGPTIGVFPGVFLLVYFFTVEDEFDDDDDELGVLVSSGLEDFFNFNGDLASKAGDVNGEKNSD